MKTELLWISTLGFRGDFVVEGFGIPATGDIDSISFHNKEEKNT